MNGWVSAWFMLILLLESSMSTLSNKSFSCVTFFIWSSGSRWNPTISPRSPFETLIVVNDVIFSYKKKSFFSPFQHFIYSFDPLQQPTFVPLHILLVLLLILYLIWYKSLPNKDILFWNIDNKNWQGANTASVHALFFIYMYIRLSSTFWQKIRSNFSDNLGPKIGSSMTWK